MVQNKPVKLDLEKMLARMGGQHALVAQIIQIFKEDAPKLIAEIEQGFQNRDCEVIHRSSHSLKGLMSNFGVVESEFEIAQVELAAKNENLETAAEHFERFKPAYQDLLSAIEADQSTSQM